MSVYDINGSTQSRLFDTSGSHIYGAYDISGDMIFPDGPISLKVMSYNVGSWTAFGHDASTSNQETWYTLQNSIFASEQADLVGLQEYYKWIGSYSVPTMLDQYFDYLYAVDKTGSKAGKALASKFALTNTAEINFEAQNGETRSYLIGDFTIAGKVIKFITAHLALDNPTITLQIAELLTAVSSFDYWILTGDFNVQFPNAESTGYAMLIEPFLNAGYNVANGGAFGFIPTFSTKQPGDDSDWRVIDNIMTSANIDITDAYTDQKKLTDHAGYDIDHLPFIAEITVN